MKRILPALLLFLLSPVCGELLSSSAPPTEFFKPLTFFTLCLLYGGGAILVRETAFRWKKGWLSILVLGAAYGIIEEGLMVKSFFDPGWMDLGILGSYGRWLGVNWVWTAELIYFHAVFSIGIPILITTLVFPAQKDAPWLSRNNLILVFALYVLDVIFGFLALTSYRPPVFPYILTIAITIGLILLARRLSDPIPGEAVVKMQPPFLFGILGFSATLIFFLISWVLPNLPIPPVVPILAFGLLVWASKRAIWHLSGKGNWKAGQLAALAGGALLPFIIIAPLIEMDQSRADDPTGMSWVGLIGMVLLILFNRRVRSTERMSGK